MNAARRLWFIYGACATIVLIVMLWGTVAVLRLESAERRATAEASRQEAARLALWRMDSWLMPQLATETGRPPSDYLAFRPEGRAYTRLLSQIESGEVLVPSPLLTLDSPYFTLHFQVDSDGSVHSPQVPSGNHRDLAEGTLLSVDRLQAKSTMLDQVRTMLGADVANSCSTVAAALPDVVEKPPIPAAKPRQQQLEGQTWNSPTRQQADNIREFQSRVSNLSSTYSQVLAQEDVGDEVITDLLAPAWLDTDDGIQLVYLRRVRSEGHQFYQGVLCDWPAIRDAMLAEIGDLFEAAQVQPVLGAMAVDETMMLATMPARLHIAAALPAAISFVSPTAITMLVAWIAVLIGLVATAFTLHATLTYAAKRSQFASAVTHELRTPLTTFRMYTEMLADDMVTDETQRRGYLQTLKNESGRLSTLVENVMSYARLEDGRGPSHRALTTVANVLDRAKESLRRRAENGRMELAIDDTTDPETTLNTDVECVGQILMNLVDNACKYAGEADDRRVHVEIQQVNGSVYFDVHDHGPGVDVRRRRDVFAAFRRGEDVATDTPGIGLGLALSRGLARDLGGELELVDSPTGARFRLTLPR